MGQPTMSAELSTEPPANGGGGLQSKSGSTVGTLAKLLLLAVVAAIAVFSALPLIKDENWIGLAIVIVITAVIFWVYLTPRAIPLKYLLPGTLFLIAFQIIPVVYTVTTAFSNFGDGHRGTKEEAITSIQGASVKEVAGAKTYKLTVGVPDGGTGIVFLLADADKNAYVGDATGLTPLDAGTFTLNAAGKITAAEGYTALNTGQASERDTEVKELSVPTENGGILSKGFSAAFEGAAVRKYDAGCDCVKDSETGQQWTADDSKGFFVDSAGANLAQGWKVNVGFSNFTDNQAIRFQVFRPLLR